MEVLALVFPAALIAALVYYVGMIAASGLG